MSNLGNQYISASYQSVLNVGTGSGDYITSNLKPITDGFGSQTPLRLSTTKMAVSGNLQITGSIESSLIPATSGTLDLGSPTKPWRHLYVSSGSVYLDDHQILSLDPNNAADTTIAAPPSGTVNLINDVVFVSQEGLGYQGAAGFTIVGGGTQFESQTRFSGDTISYHTGSIYKTNYWVNNANVQTGDTSFELEIFKDNFKLASIENSRHIRTLEDSEFTVYSQYKGTGSYNGAITHEHQNLINNRYAEVIISDASVYLGVGALSASNPTTDLQISSGSIRGAIEDQALTSSFQLIDNKFVVTGSIVATNGITGSIAGTASYATNALSASHAVNANSAITASQALNSNNADYATNAGNADLLSGTGSAQFANTGSNTFNGTQTISGSLNVTGSITALSASITYLQTIYQTSSVIYTSGSNVLGDEASDVQTLNGRVDVPLGNLNVTGATTSSLGFFGNLQGTASFASNALSASQAQNAVSASQSQNSVSSSNASFAEDAGKLDGKDSSEFATTGSNQFTGQQTINNNSGFIVNDNTFTAYAGIDFYTGGTGTQGQLTSTADKTYVISKNDLYIQSNIGGTGTGSMYLTSNKDFVLSAVSGTTTIRSNVDLTGSMNIRNGNFEVISNNTTLNPDFYVTSSVSGQSNMVFGWGDNPGAGGAGASQANYTGSLRITGSNNIVNLPQLRATTYGFGVDSQGYISGSNNWINSNAAGIFLNTGSLLFPKTQGNILGPNSAIGMNFTTSSLSGGHPSVNNNLIMAGVLTLNHPSGSPQGVSNNGILGGSISSTQNFVTNTRPVISSNNVIGAVTLNHISSSINYQNNYNNSPITINNHLSSSGIANNSLTFTNNAVFGGSSNTGLGVWVSGSQSSNATRTISDNLFAGKNNVVSSSFVSSSNANLVASLVVGNGLNVFGTHTVGTNGGSAFLGRFNDNNIADAQNIVFAVGTGTSSAARRTGLYVTSGSLVGVSGSLNVIGDTVITGSGDLYMYGHKMFNTAEFWSTQTQSGSAGVSGSINFNNSGSAYGVSVVSGSRLTVANAGTYNIQFSAQVETSAGSDTGYVWYKKNGTNIADSATKVVLANNTAQVMTVNIIDDASANDYYELGYQFTNGTATLLAEAASGNIPAIPSVITTVTQVR